jgi:hypothetical protein
MLVSCICVGPRVLVPQRDEPRGIRRGSLFLIRQSHRDFLYLHGRLFRVRRRHCFFQVEWRTIRTISPTTLPLHFGRPFGDSGAPKYGRALAICVLVILLCSVSQRMLAVSPQFPVDDSVAVGGGRDPFALAFLQGQTVVCPLSNAHSFLFCHRGC